MGSTSVHQHSDEPAADRCFSPYTLIPKRRQGGLRGACSFIPPARRENRLVLPYRLTGFRIPPTLAL